MNDAAQSQAEVSEDRRGFLRGLVATGSGVAVLAVATGSAVAAVGDDNGEVAAEPEQSKGYQVTQQVLDYYRTAAL